jgi:hypothetical protein
MLLPVEDRRRWCYKDSLNLDILNYWLDTLPSKSIELARAKRKYLSPEFAKEVAGWDFAISENTEESRQRVLRIIQLASERNTPALNKAIEQYVCVPYVMDLPQEGNSLLLHLVPADDSEYCALHPDTPRLSPFPTGEVSAVLAVLELAQAGFLHQLKSCGQCKQMFFPGRGKQTNCSTECSKRAYSKTPKEKARRAAAARKRYRDTSPLA